MFRSTVFQMVVEQLSPATQVLWQKTGLITPVRWLGSSITPVSMSHSWQQNLRTS